MKPRHGVTLVKMSLSSTLSVVLHACGILAVLELYASEYHGMELLEVAECKGNETCWRRIVDLLPDQLLVMNVGFVLKWVGGAVATLYAAYVAFRLYRAVFSRIDLVFHQDTRDVGYMVSPGALEVFTILPFAVLLCSMSLKPVRVHV